MLAMAWGGQPNGNSMFRSLCFTAVLLVCASTASAKRPPPLTDPLADTLPVEVVYDQRELGVAVDGLGSFMMKQGDVASMLFGGAIQHVQVKKAEAQVAPFRDALVGFDFRPVMEAALRGRLARATDIAPTMKVSFYPADVDAETARAAPRALVLYPGYFFDNDFEYLMVNIQANVVTRSVTDRGKVKAQYEFSRLYSFRYPLVNGEGENLDRWKRVPAETLRSMIESGIGQAADMLAFDFSPEGGARHGNRHPAGNR